MSGVPGYKNILNSFKFCWITISILKNVIGWFVHRSSKLLIYCLGTLCLDSYGASPVYTADNGHIKGGWYPWKPYQYLEKVSAFVSSQAWTWSCSEKFLKKNLV